MIIELTLIGIGIYFIVQIGVTMCLDKFSYLGDNNEHT